MTSPESLRTTNLRHRETGSGRRRRTPDAVDRCLVCGHPAIDADVDGRFVTTSCSACLAVLVIEFDPPDQPALRARIERIDESE
jgi:hypothetical protein